MDSQKSRNVSIAKAFNAAVINQEYATFDEICATNVYIINNFGASLGPGNRRAQDVFWDSLS